MTHLSLPRKPQGPQTPYGTATPRPVACDLAARLACDYCCGAYGTPDRRDTVASLQYQHLAATYAIKSPGTWQRTVSPNKASHASNDQSIRDKTQACSAADWARPCNGSGAGTSRRSQDSRYILGLLGLHILRSQRACQPAHVPWKAHWALPDACLGHVGKAMTQVLPKVTLHRNSAGAR